MAPGKEQVSTTEKPNPEQAARDTLAYLQNYQKVCGHKCTAHLISPADHVRTRKGVEVGTWGVSWEDGPWEWAVALSLGMPLDIDGVEFPFSTSIYDCFSEPYETFDLFWYPCNPEERPL